jgi:hypothetical protein
MMEAGLRNMTVSVGAAQLLRSVHQSSSLGAAFNRGSNYRVSGVFRRQQATTYDTVSNGAAILQTTDVSGSGLAERPPG